MSQTQDNSSNKYFNRYVALLAMVRGPEFVDFLAQARPQVVQMGFYGLQRYTLGDTDSGSGYPMRLPVRGIYQILEQQTGFNQQVHRLRGKVVSHFSMTTTWGDPKEKTGFFESYYFLAHESVRP